MATADLDVVVVGAGFAGLYALLRLREMGMRVLVVDEADDVGGTWYWNRYPGARCDVPTTDYAYSFDPELERDWQWSEKYATQPEILAYLGHVADRYGLRPDIRFGCRVDRAVFQDAPPGWRVQTSAGDELVCRHLVMASGCLSVPKSIDIEGVDRFAGESYLTARWPHGGVELAGKRVAVVGTGSSGIQAIPLIAAEAAQLTVFQRTPNYSMPARNGPPPPARVAALRADRDGYRQEARRSRTGVATGGGGVSVLATGEEERRARFEAVWEAGELFALSTAFSDIGVNPAANEIVCELLREKIRATVHDPATADALCPTSYPYATKRPCLDSGYFETFNRPNVRLVDLRRTPIVAVTETGIDTTAESFEFDVIVYATGFDAMTGPITAVDLQGRGGARLREQWAAGPTTYLGLMTAGFPNLFFLTGPGSPSVLSNMVVSIEQHVEWVAECLDALRRDGYDTIEPTPAAQAGWDRHVQDCADITLFSRAASWYMGANVPGKPRVFLPYVGGVDAYREACQEVVDRGYLGFVRSGPAGTRCNDGVVRRLQPDVFAVLRAVAALDLPRLETLSPADARAAAAAGALARPPGPPVGAVIDGVLPGPASDLRYRVYTPAGSGPYPVVLYLHGGGFVLGAHDADDPLCRDLCVRSGALVVSVDYRHAPESRFPAAVEDAWGALCWVARHIGTFGGDADRLCVAGWSAGANLATTACRMARDAGGPPLRAQLLLMPLTDCRLSGASMAENADGYLLTAPMLEWFVDHYVDPDERDDPRASPLRAGDLSGVAPAVVVTAEFDPLRDQGVAYAEALAAAGVPTRHIAARGHIHTSPWMVDVVLSGAPVRAEVADALVALLAPRP